MATNSTSTRSTSLPKDIFAVDVQNHELLKLAYDSYLAGNRGANATTLQRGEVRGGGKKPWRQKGTGRARFGSIRNPIWRGGGVVFGPRGNENYTKKLSKTSKHVALRQALTLASEAKKVTIKNITSNGKTAEMAKFLADNKFDRHVLLVVEEKTPELIRGTSNLQNVELVRPTYLTVYHLLNADHVVITPAALKLVSEWLSPSAAKTAPSFDTAREEA